MPFGLQTSDLIIITIVALLLFGPKRLPEIAHYVGKTFTEFRAGTQELAQNFHDGMNQNHHVQYQAVPPPPAQPVATANTDAEKFCAQCGAPSTLDAFFCNKCGKALTPK